MMQQLVSPSTESRHLLFRLEKTFLLTQQNYFSCKNYEKTLHLKNRKSKTNSFKDTQHTESLTNCGERRRVGLPLPF